MTTTSTFTCPAAGRNQYWLHWSAEMNNRPHSTLTKGAHGTTKYGWAAKGSGQNLNEINTIIGYIANGKYAGKGPNNRYKMHAIEKNDVDVGPKSTLALGLYKSTMINKVSDQIFEHLPKITSQTPQRNESPKLHFTLGWTSQYKSSKYPSSIYKDIAKCLTGKEMDLVVQNIDNRCWCEIHSLNNRKK